MGLARKSVTRLVSAVSTASKGMSPTRERTFSGNCWPSTDSHRQQARTFYPTGYEGVLVDKFQEDHVRFGARQSAGSNLLLTLVLPNVILLLLIGGFMWYVLRRYSGKHPPTT